jgi:hypothetical protein
MMPKWPTWWSWELELSPHVFKRMADRDFNEVDVRRMLSGASGLRPDTVPGRWRIETRHRRATWEVIVEPDTHGQLVVVITAYRVEP